MLIPLLLDLQGAPVTPVPAVATGMALPVIYVRPPGPLWVNENAADTMIVNPNPIPVGSYQ